MQPSCTQLPWLLNYMVMRPLCDTNMMNYMYCAQIDPYNLSGNVFGNNRKEKLRFVDFCFLTSLMHRSCLYIWTKWSWGLCVIPIWWITCIMNKLTNITYLAIYLVTIKKKKLRFVDFCLLSRLCSQIAPSCLNFWTKWS